VSDSVGRRTKKLCPAVSPHKTVAGSIGGMAGSIAAVQLVILLTDRVLKRTKLDLSVHRFIKAIVRVVLYFAALLMIASEMADWGVKE